MSQQSQQSPTQGAPEAPAWHALSGEETLEQLSATEEGLSTETAQARLAQYGPNRLQPPQRRSALMRFLTQFHNVLIYVLLVAAVVTLLLEHWVDTGVILAVVVINAFIGFLQEGKAERALDAIRNLLSPQAVALRDGKRQTVDAAELVPGDIVVLQSGDKIPADMRILHARNLHADEAALTGESEPAPLNNEAVSADAPVGDRTGIAFSGTLVTAGTGTGVVVATGDNTEIGRINQMLAEVETLTTPLLRQMTRFGQVLSAAILGLAAIMFAFGVLIRDYTAAEMFLSAVGLAVAAIPEGLPAIITITLAIGVQTMAHRNAIIRRLPAVETLGSVSVICSDKTGTLTRNEMTVTSIVTPERSIEVTGAGYEPSGDFLAGGHPTQPGDDSDLMELVRAGLLCNDATVDHDGGQWRMEGDPTEGALVTLALKSGLEHRYQQEQLPRTDAIPFESEHKFMATLHHDHAGHGFVYLKGAPERVLSMCNAELVDGDPRPLNPDTWHQRAEELASQGQRVLALAFKPAPRDDGRELSFDQVEGGLTLLGLVGIMDPPREEAIEAVADCRRAGINVKMITGDHALTARSIGAKMGIGDGEHAVTGPELDDMSDEELQRVVQEVDVFARVSPEHKLRLVEAQQARGGSIIAMTGDGVNDAPALKRANVGIAMGIKGTEVAKEAAEMVLADDNFASIARAVRAGRTVYENIKKSILFILPTNGGEALTILGAILLGNITGAGAGAAAAGHAPAVLPITPVQILWVNMITAVTLALALAFDPPERDTMERPPRDPNEAILSPFMIFRVVFVSLILVTGTFGLFLWERATGTGIDYARTVAVNTLVVFEAFYLLNTRHIFQPITSLDDLIGNRYVLIAIGAVIVFQIIWTYVPFMNTLFGSSPLSLATWGIIVAVGFSVFVLVELEKVIGQFWRRHRARARTQPA
jgi:magnesium-transporting ATPase (P-type)